MVVPVAAIPLAVSISLASEVVAVSAASSRICLAVKAIRVGALAASRVSLQAVQVSAVRLGRTLAR